MTSFIQTRRGRWTLLLAILGLAVLCGLGMLRGREMPLISLAAEGVPLPYSQVFLAVGLVIALILSVSIALLGYRWAIVVGPLVILAECALFFNKPIPNTLPSTWLTLTLLILVGLLYNRALRKGGRPSGFQIAVEALGEGILGFMNNAVGDKARLFFPLVATFFLFIAVSNWCGILPGFGSVGVRVPHHAETAAPAAHGEEADSHTEARGEEADSHTEARGEEADSHTEARGEELELIPFFRSANAHLSTTLALAIISVIAAQIFGFRVQNAAYLNKYLNFRAISPKPAPGSLRGFQAGVTKFARAVEVLVNGIVGLLEIILETLKVLPFSFRLFGNIFAGEVLLFVVSYLFLFVFPVIFLGLELFVGLIQGLIFSMLTLVFFSIATTSHHGDESHH